MSIVAALEEAALLKRLGDEKDLCVPPRPAAALCARAARAAL